ncbi:hypothetical protein [Polaribacter septentrionalilitoris]|uniref:hypothetical protein n=1 Tax=Polaribacter septentrionalilitoris TaxID=2494657 RepID=UPI0013587353|nr:hypothetical protein [Polaribacter septentrionalilitoris]
MLEYLKFLISNLKSFDKRLKNIAFFQGKTWMRISSNEFNEKWFFRNNGLLTISRDGNIIDGKYEFLNDYLIIEFLNNKILLNKSSIYNEILLLKKDSNDSELFAFYDNSKFSPQNFLKHLEFSRKNDLNIKQLKLVDNSKVEIIRKPKQKGIIRGNTVLINGQVPIQEYIETKFNYYNLNDGVISKIFYKRKYKIFDNEIIIKQKSKELSVDDTIISSKRKISNGFHKIKFIYGINVKNNIITKVYYISYLKTLLKKTKIEIWKKTSDEYLIGDLVRERDKFVNNGKYWIGLFEIIKVTNGKIS